MTRKSAKPPLVLVFAATDGTGGAGIIADCRAIEAAGAIPLAVVTAITAQNLNGVLSYQTISPRYVREQFAALKKANIAAVKIGVVGVAARVIAECLDELTKLTKLPIVLDPVLSPTSGSAFADKEQQKHLLKYLLPRTTVITPNSKELAALSGRRQIATGAQTLLNAGTSSVLITDVKVAQKTYCQLFTSPSSQSTKKTAKTHAANTIKQSVKNPPITPCQSIHIKRRAGEYHGGGCFLSSFLAAELAAGESLTTATLNAQRATLKAVDNAITLPLLGKQKLLRPIK